MEPFDFSTFPILTTPSLTLRQMTPEDAADLFAFASDPEVQKYDSDPPMQELAEAVSRIIQTREWFETKQAIPWGIALNSENRVIGSIAFMFWDSRKYVADLGYTVARPYWRQGIATEAVRALMDFGFERMHLHRINVDTRMDNLASVALMRKLGFVHEGVRRECIRNDDGTYQSWGMFGMLEHEYAPIASTIRNQR